ncbi:reverse transcriptase domain-containing protein [Tanacetum coccineum]
MFGPCQRNQRFPPIASMRREEAYSVIEVEIWTHEPPHVHRRGSYTNSLRALRQQLCQIFRDQKSLHKSMDELYNRKINVTIQWHHWKIGFLSKASGKILPAMLKNLEKCIEKERLPLDIESGTSLHATKTTSMRATLAGSTQTKGRIDYIHGPELKYTLMEKLVLSLVFAAKRPRRASTKVERHARRTQYNVPPKDIGERTDTGGLPRRKARRKPARYTSYRNLTRAVDTVHGWIVMCRWIMQYKALIAGLRIAAQMGVRNVKKNLYKGGSIDDDKEEEKLDTPITEYLKRWTLPGKERSQANSRIRGKYTNIGRRFSTNDHSKAVARCSGHFKRSKEIREKFMKVPCSMHAYLLSVVAKAMRLGYYWPTMHQDAREMIRMCNDYQIHQPMPRNLQHKLTPMTAPLPFYKWGIDIAGPFSEGPGKVKFLIVAMDYFTKWIEAKAVATITGNQSNGLVERANRSLGEGVKARLGEGNKNWVEEHPHVLWAHRTMIKSSHRDTPFPLIYGTEAVIPAKIRMPIYRTAAVDVVHNDEELWLTLDLLDENNDASHAMAGGKLGPKWEGPYEVTEALGDGAYKLRSMDGAVLSRTWNIANLKKCYL